MNMGKIIIFTGLVIVLVGVVFWLVGKVGIPGDIKISGERYTFYFPIVTSIIVSIVLTILLNLFLRK
jgi:hypothetical protein